MKNKNLQIKNLEKSILILEEYDRKYYGSKRHDSDLALLKFYKKELKEYENTIR